MRTRARHKKAPAFLFDLDGTLVDSVYQHVLAWREALEKAGIELAVWQIHRRIGMSGGLFVHALSRETGRHLAKEEVASIQHWHAEAYARVVAQVRPLPGARELLDCLTESRVPWAIATSGRIESAGLALKILGVDPNKATVITRDQVRYAKPDPDLFLMAAKRLGVDIETLDGGGRQCVGPAGGAPGQSAGGRAALRRLWRGGAGTGRRLPRLSGPRRPVAPSG